ncbi:MAG TPA: response regulator [Polyangiaceae bacterium]
MPRILICDDDEDTAEVLGEFLVDNGFACVITHSYDQVVARRDEALRCSLAILDVNLGLGRPTGVEVYRWLQREHFAGSVVFLTGHAGTSSMLDGARKVGVPILAKPVAAETLLSVARQVGAA